MKKRIEEIVKRIPRCSSLADVGCDHGFCAYLALERGLAGKVIITDISEKCLKKAEKLLSSYIEEGVCVSVCTDGLDGVEPLPECVLMAGMGGDTITNVLERSGVPEKFVLQPMKNTKTVREYLLSKGCRMTEDNVFYDKKYYFIISGERGRGEKENYTQIELEFGRDSLKNPVFAGYIGERLERYRERLAAAATGAGREEIMRKISFLEEVQKCARKMF
ncbi:MAG: class I SAM-dependent methyltransferase [Clostridia bacterium]|nr:class I SAM-dependent methyltransferase [Clostridia bacterium]